MRILTEDLTSTCNLGCVFCYQKTRGELSLDKAEGYVHQFRPDVLELGGGETFLYGNLVNLLKDTSREVKRFRLATNGTVQRKDLKQLPLSIRRRISVQVSLPAVSNGLYEQITGRSLLDSVIGNLRVLKEYFTLGINFPVYQGNFSEVELAMGTAHSFDVPIRFDLVMPIGNGKNVRLLTREQIEKLRRFVLEKRLEGTDTRFNLASQLQNSCPVLETTYGISKTAVCPAETGNKLYVAPDGFTKSCEFMGD